MYVVRSRAVVGAPFLRRIYFAGKSCMRPVIPSVGSATLAITCGSCDAFRGTVPSMPSPVPAAVAARNTATAGWLRLGRRRNTLGMQAGASSTPSAAEGEGQDGDAVAPSSYPGPVIPRVGGAMPEQRPGWFRVPAPGGKHTKVRPSCCRLFQKQQAFFLLARQSVRVESNLTEWLRRGARARGVNADRARGRQLRWPPASSLRRVRTLDPVCRMHVCCCASSIQQSTAVVS